MQRSWLLWITVIVTALTSSPLFSQSGGLVGGDQPSLKLDGPLGDTERQALYEQFVAKWSAHVLELYGGSVASMARRFGPLFANGDPHNIREALQRDTFEGAYATLRGRGHVVTDERVIEASRSAHTSAPVTTTVSSLLGDVGTDMVYTPVTPCRVVDTRNTGAGPIAVNASRSFVGVNASSFVSQGGSATNCGTLGLAPGALALNVTAVAPAAAGYATVYSYGTTQPFAASVNYVAGDVVNNAIITKIPDPAAAFDVTIYSSATSHYVVDIVGYFDTPQATPLQCTHTFVSNSAAANATFDYAIPGCPAGYTITGANCRTPGFDDADWAISGLYQTGGTVGAFCSGRNKQATPISVEGVARCCRIPGR